MNTISRRKMVLYTKDWTVLWGIVVQMKNLFEARNDEEVKNLSILPD